MDGEQEGDTQGSMEIMLSAKGNSCDTHACVRVVKKKNPKHIKSIQLCFKPDTLVMIPPSGCCRQR